MQKYNYSFSEFGFSSQLIRDLIDEKETVIPFINSFFSEEHIKSQISKKVFNTEQRTILKNALLNQNKGIDLSELTLQNIELIQQNNTFTITTGHQLNFLTGPLYSIYKIIQVIVWSEKLNKTHSDYNFTPVFWMATEDHDFEEINHIHLFNSTFEIENEGQENFIAGEITPTNFEGVKTDILSKFSDEDLKQKIANYLSFYENKNLAQATQALLNFLFKDFGLIIIDGNDASLKQLFSPVIKRELVESVTQEKVSQSNQQLTALGYHNQVFLRECNLFYIKDKTTRYRIIKTENGFEINNQFYILDQLLQELDSNPERFSPNALMRPLYQETVLPNLVYFGGGGEIAYWLQLKDLFDALNLTYPLLRVRDSFVLLNQKDITLLNDLNYSVLDLKAILEDLLKSYVKSNATVDISIQKEIELLNQLKHNLLSKVDKNNLGLTRFIEGELVRMENQLDKIEKKLIQNEKKNQDKTLKQIQRLRDKIYPNNGFQERYENVLQYVHHANFIDTLKKEAEQHLTDQPQIRMIEN